MKSLLPLAALLALLAACNGSPADPGDDPPAEDGHAFTYTPPAGAPAISSMSVRGSFNGWEPEPMAPAAAGEWRAVVDLPDGTHRYKFFINGEWVQDMCSDATWGHADAGGVVHLDADGCEPDGFGGGCPGEGFQALLNGLDSDRFWGRYYKAPALHRVLLENLQPGTLHLGQECSGYVEDGDQVTALVTGGGSGIGAAVAREEPVVRPQRRPVAMERVLDPVHPHLQQAELRAFHEEHGRAATVTSVQPEGRFGAITSDGHGRISRFEEKPAGDGAWINAGFFVFEPSVLGDLGPDLERDGLPALAASGRLHARPHHGTHPERGRAHHGQALFDGSVAGDIEVLPGSAGASEPGIVGHIEDPGRTRPVILGQAGEQGLIADQHLHRWNAGGHQRPERADRGVERGHNHRGCKRDPRCYRHIRVPRCGRPDKGRGTGSSRVRHQSVRIAGPVARTVQRSRSTGRSGNA